MWERTRKSGGSTGFAVFPADTAWSPALRNAFLWKTIIPSRSPSAKKRYLEMHEYHLVEDIIRKACLAAGEKKIDRVNKVSLKLSELSGLEESSVRLYFEQIALNTVLDKAQLDIQVIPAQLKCKQCNITFTRQKGQFECPQCGELASPVPVDKFFFEIS
jgi:hydrogenase nickel incorporation protein HypA/HybF